MTNGRINEVGYDRETWERAGWHRASDDPRVTWRTVDVGETGTTMTIPAHVGTVDAERRADVIGSVRRACPGIDAVRGLRAARTLAALRSAPADVAARAAALATESDGTAPGTNGAAPDPWGARQHDTVAKRSRKGTTSVEVKRRGVAPVIGGTHAVPPTDADLAASDVAVDARTVAAVLLDGVRRVNCGAVALEVQRVADIAYPEDRTGVPELQGTDVTAWSEVVDGGGEWASVAYKRAWLSGLDAVPTADAIAAPAAVYRSHTRRTVRTATFPLRRRLPMGSRRKGDPEPRCRPAMLRTVSEPFAPPVLATALAWELPAPAADRDHRFIGHKLIARPATASRRRGAKRASAARTAARTVGTIDREPTTVAGWREIVAMVNRGERVKVGAVTITRGSGRNAKYRATDARPDHAAPDGKHPRWEARTPDALAMRLA